MSYCSITNVATFGDRDKLILDNIVIEQPGSTDESLWDFGATDVYDRDTSVDNGRSNCQRCQ